ncbi:hypothetical protein [Streptosporangium lutulentum]|uniref:Uncharacterized protein n=1 Tax=Streptosporangium lutulentum TaxID=1461250 RepID=A0ABT9Q8Z3_9ACTN|nr:hypothetical protein [Streptosporangium lutulentum]MDP9843221.1 hypothetical protein [Streptosporangium lutulentum]
MARDRTGPEERKLFHTSRIDAEKNGVRRFWLAACWVAAELKHLAKRDPAKAHATGLHLAKQMRTIAADLNQQHLDHLKTQKGGHSRV